MASSSAWYQRFAASRALSRRIAAHHEEEQFVVRESGCPGAVNPVVKHGREVGETAVAVVGREEGDLSGCDPPEGAHEEIIDAGEIVGCRGDRHPGLGSDRSG